MSSNTNFGRVIQVLTGNREFTIEGYKIEFETFFDADPEPNTGTVKIYNLSEGTINEIKKNQAIIVNAGYTGDVGTIFSGGIVKKLVKTENLDKIMTLEIGDAVSAWLGASVNKAYKPGITAKQLIYDLLGSFGLAIGNFELSKNPTYAKGRVVSGSLQSILRQIVVNDCQTKFHISNGTVYIRPANKGTETGFLLNSDTGLLESPTPIEEEGNPAAYSVRCLLNHRINTDSIVRIESKTANGNFLVLKGRHQGSDSGDFITEMEVAAI